MMYEKPVCSGLTLRAVHFSRRQAGGTLLAVHRLSAQLLTFVRAVRSRILSLFCKSVAAANMFPQTITTIQEAVFGGLGHLGYTACMA
jgi:hypothetical protein